MWIYGQHNALLCGIRLARCNLIVTIYDDLQHDFELIPVLLDKNIKGNKVVYGSPTVEKHGVWRDLATVLTKVMLSNVMNVKSGRHIRAFRVFYTYLHYSFVNYQGHLMNLDVLFTWGTSKFGYVEIPHHKRELGRSNPTLKKLILHGINRLSGLSTIPLRLATVIGFLFLFYGILILLSVLVSFTIQGGVVPRFTLFASISGIISGVQLFTLGIMGEYKARMYFRLMDKPTYTVIPETK